ncbi:MAG: hypothetical protein NT038_03310 [Euryarchaeota archaeon]|nr:hypothetical protein [Euryarchaeota archaeon]
MTAHSDTPYYFETASQSMSDSQHEMVLYRKELVIVGQNHEAFISSLQCVVLLERLVSP